jgi:hypothetical protein
MIRLATVVASMIPAMDTKVIFYSPVAVAVSRVELYQ